MTYLDYVVGTGQQQKQIMREYSALLNALVAVIQELHPEWDYYRALDEARRRYISALAEQGQVRL